MQQAYRYIFKILGSHKRLILLAGLVAVLESGLQLLYPLLSRFQVEALEGRRASLTDLLSTPAAVFVAIVVLVLVAQVVGTLVGAMGRLTDTYIRERMGIATDRMLYQKMEELDAGFLENPKNRRLIYIFFDISILPNSFLEFLSSGIKTFIAVVGILPIIALTDLRVCAIIAGFSVVQVGLLRLRMRRENAYRLYKERAMAGINEMIFLLRHHFHRLLSASGEERIMPKFWDKRNEALRLEVRQTKISIFYEILNHLLENLSLFAASILIGWQVLQGRMSIGSFIMVTLYTSQLQSALTSINMNIGEWYRLRAIFLQLGFFLTMKPRVRLEGCQSQKERISGHISLDQVRFRYPHLQEEEQRYLSYLVQQLDLDNAKRDVWPGDQELVREWRLMLESNRQPLPPVLRGVTCRFERGKITALVGRNGSGKTTLMKLLVRNYDPDGGAITLRDHELVGLTPRYLRHLFSMVTQEPFLLESFSIRDNALLGCSPDIDDAKIWSVLHKLGLGQVIEAFPNTLDSVLGDEVNLSGGQSQLLVIARTMLQQRPFVILDEGTNQLDAEHELGILQMLQQMKRQATIIVITHRMTTARKADSILVLDDGRIVEQGTHEELVRQESGLYRRFWDIQVVK